MDLNLAGFDMIFEFFTYGVIVIRVGFPGPGINQVKLFRLHHLKDLFGKQSLAYTDLRAHLIFGHHL